MSKKVIINVISVVCLMMGCTGRKYAEMQERLRQLDAFNQSDSIFRSTTEAKALADYFDDHGTPNEQMLAYYLLGRAYHDLHEAPMALKYFQMASERADTTAEDCDYRQLSRVYGQMSNVFYQQGLYEQDLRFSDLSEKYGWRGKDTLNALLAISGKVLPLKKLGEEDSVLKLCDRLSDMFYKYGYKKHSAVVRVSVIRNLIDRGEMKKAERNMLVYESESGFFNSDHEIEKGREIYYYTKGYYYLHCGKLDSAEYYFRKELRDGRDFNNQNAGSRGLALLFQKKHMPDSAAKYALYSYEMNDSVYAQKVTSEVEIAQAMYDYSRNQEIAWQASEKAKKEHIKLQTTIIAFILFVMIAVAIARKVYKMQRVAKEKYKENINKLAKTQDDVIKLRSHGEELSKMLMEKEKLAERLTTEIENYKEKAGQQKKSTDLLLQESTVFASLKKSAIKGVLLSDDDWHEIYVMIIEIMPSFNKFISAKKLELNDKEYKTCILIRLHFIQKEIANMLGVSPAYIAKVCNNAMQKLFGVTGKAKDLEMRLKSFS